MGNLTSGCHGNTFVGVKLAFSFSLVYFVGPCTLLHLGIITRYSCSGVFLWETMGVNGGGKRLALKSVSSYFICLVPTKKRI